MSTHTPGPWHVSELDYRTIGPRRIVGQGTMGEMPQLQAVARVTERMDETAANARLIAAAPELLAALKSCIEICDRECIGDLTLIHAAIAKAEGRS
jgi:hypothetical protein